MHKQKTSVFLYGSGIPEDSTIVDYWMEETVTLRGFAPELLTFMPNPAMVITAVQSPCGTEMKCADLWEGWKASTGAQIKLEKPLMLKSGRAFGIQIRNEKPTSGYRVQEYLEITDAQSQKLIAIGLAAIVSARHNGTTLATAERKVKDLHDPTVFGKDTARLYLDWAKQFTIFYQQIFQPRNLQLQEESAERLREILQKIYDDDQPPIGIKKASVQ